MITGTQGELTLYVGDIHSDFETFEKVCRFVLEKRPGIGRIVQVGDFGFWPNGHAGYWYRKSSLPVPVFFIDGNHEDHRALTGPAADPAANRVLYDATYIPRGTVRQGVLFVGGADSPDKEMRSAGIDWFPEENIRPDDVRRAEEAIRTHFPIHTMVCHETTEGAFELIRRRTWRRGDANRIYLERLFRLARPRLCIHGHYHFHRNYEYLGCRFVALRNPDHFHFSLKGRDSVPLLTQVVAECCLIVDARGNVVES